MKKLLFVPLFLPLIAYAPPVWEHYKTWQECYKRALRQDIEAIAVYLPRVEKTFDYAMNEVKDIIEKSEEAHKLSVEEFRTVIRHAWEYYHTMSLPVDIIEAEHPYDMSGDYPNTQKTKSFHTFQEYFIKALRQTGYISQETLENYYRTLDTLKLHWLKEMLGFKEYIRNHIKEAGSFLMGHCIMDMNDLGAAFGRKREQEAPSINPQLIHPPLFELLPTKQDRSQNFYKAIAPTAEHRKLLNELLRFYSAEDWDCMVRPKMELSHEEWSSHSAIKVIEYCVFRFFMKEPLLVQAANSHILNSIIEASQVARNSKSERLTPEEVHTIINNAWANYCSHPEYNTVKTEEATRIFNVYFAAPFIHRLQHREERISDETARECMIFYVDTLTAQ